MTKEPILLKLREAKPCPFCGHSPEMQHWHGGGPQKRLIGCSSDECLVSPNVSGPTSRKALENWNRRIVLVECRDDQEAVPDRASQEGRWQVKKPKQKFISRKKGTCGFSVDPHRKLSQCVAWKPLTRRKIGKRKGGRR